MIVDLFFLHPETVHAKPDTAGEKRFVGVGCYTRFAVIYDRGCYPSVNQ